MTGKLLSLLLTLQRLKIQLFLCHLMCVLFFFKFQFTILAQGNKLRQVLVFFLQFNGFLPQLFFGLYTSGNVSPCPAAAENHRTQKNKHNGEESEIKFIEYSSQFLSLLTNVTINFKNPNKLFVSHDRDIGLNGVGGHYLAFQIRGAFFNKLGVFFPLPEHYNYRIQVDGFSTLSCIIGKKDLSVREKDPEVPERKIISGSHKFLQNILSQDCRTQDFALLGDEL